MVDGWILRAARLLWRSQCVLCGRSGQPGIDLCLGCDADLPLVECACARCATPLSGAPDSGAWCGACLHRPPLFHASRAPLRYEYPLDRMVQRLKYHRDLACGRVLGLLLARALRERGAPPPQALVPMPLAHARYRARGFNQAHELALPVSAALRVPIRADLVVRHRDTQEQAGLKQAERRRNVRRAFALTQPLRERHVAILDDVMTTGSTANELAKVLRRGGATFVEVWTVARAGGASR